MYTLHADIARNEDTPVAHMVHMRTPVESLINLEAQIQGQIYHLLGALLPLPDADHQFLQIYFMGNHDAEVDRRCAHNPTVKRTIVQELQTFLHQNNDLVKCSKLHWIACHQIAIISSLELTKHLLVSTLGGLTHQQSTKWLLSLLEKICSLEISYFIVGTMN
ncbi:hypothetical protein MSG28_000594 [Choristoneura fumiferana]|uniref:Uncharacterized protein n=1 Tax=Choristoneura fumiferana TaxID=7141 RepID=A0ACC0K1J0_CHOFU|nr:hypothetical protein MSG28_000594 [Choristoneura fumiferana]